MKSTPQTPAWLPVILHLSHGLVAAGVGYMVGYSAVIYSAAAPGSPRALLSIAAVILLAAFEVSFLVYLILRRRRMRALWRDVAAFTRADEYQQAREALLQLLTYGEYRLRPQPVLYALGLASEALGEDREAMTLYRRCGDHPPALQALGVMQAERGLHERAGAAFRKLVARRPRDTFALILLATALFYDGKREAAIKLLKRRLEERPRSELLRQNLARLERGEEPRFDIEPPERP